MPCGALLAGLILFVAAGIAPAATPALQLEVSLEPASSQFEAVAVVQPTRRDFRFVLHESLVIRSAEVAGKPLKFVSLGGMKAFRCGVSSYRRAATLSASATVDR
jgi:hypothetical protein